MIDRFEELLHELGAELALPLHTDKVGACTLKINGAPDVQLECGRLPGILLMAAFISEIPPGKYRENILKDALKANASPSQYGILGYSERNNQLALFSFISMAEINGKTLCSLLDLFIDKVMQWRSSVETGTTASLVSTSSQTRSGMFGL